LLVNLLSTKSDTEAKKDLKYLKKILLFDEEWDIISNLVEILELFAEATDYLGRSNYCTYSIMVPVLIELKKNYINEIKNNLYNTMNYYWPNLTSPSSLLPSLLDPRCKNLSFVSFAERFTTENLLCDEYKKMKNNIDKEKKNVRTEVKSTSVKKKTKSSILSSFKKHMPVTVEEISDYLKLEEIDVEYDSFVWWYERHRAGTDYNISSY
ncbi:7745_t:CDS:2, partial [Scutellospora calospora]